jgi:transcription termination factor Rho
MTPHQLYLLSKYLQRVVARGTEEEQELYSLIQSVTRLSNSCNNVYTKEGKTAA